MSNLLAVKILKSNDFFISLDEKAIDDSVIKKEFYSVYDFKKGRSIRKEEILDSSKIEKILLLYRSLLFFNDSIKFSFENIKNPSKKNEGNATDLNSGESENSLEFLLFRIIYSLRIEVLLQFIYYLEVIVFEKNEKYDSFLEQLLSFLAQLDSKSLLIVGIQCSRFIFKGLDLFLQEFFNAAIKQMPHLQDNQENSLSRLQRIIRHSIANLCNNYDDFKIKEEQK